MLAVRLGMRLPLRGCTIASIVPRRRFTVAGVRSDDRRDRRDWSKKDWEEYEKKKRDKKEREKEKEREEEKEKRKRKEKDYEETKKEKEKARERESEKYKNKENYRHQSWLLTYRLHKFFSAKTLKKARKPLLYTLLFTTVLTTLHYIKPAQSLSHLLAPFSSSAATHLRYALAAPTPNSIKTHIPPALLCTPSAPPAAWLSVVEYLSTDYPTAAVAFLDLLKPHLGSQVAEMYLQLGKPAKALAAGAQGEVLAQCYTALGRIEEALVCWREVERNGDVEKVPVLNNIAACLSTLAASSSGKRQGELLREAIEVERRAVKEAGPGMEKERVKGMCMLGELNKRIGDDEVARKWFKRARAVLVEMGEVEGLESVAEDMRGVRERIGREMEGAGWRVWRRDVIALVEE